MPDQITPEVTWAQRSSSLDETKNIVFLTVMVPDVAESDLKLDLQPKKLTVDGYSKSKKVQYHVELEFFDEIDPKESKIRHTDRDVDMVLRKKELKEEYWPRLLKESKRLHFLKTDFDKWVDEDEQNPAADEDLMNNMGGMGGMGGGDFGGFDFSKLGGGGMPDLGSMGDMGGLDGDGDGGESSGDDEEMPSLEESEKDVKAGAEGESQSNPKIEEVDS